ncbi:hypothetical protein ACLOJK_014291 [Asimina triloba]
MHAVSGRYTISKNGKARHRLTNSPAHRAREKRGNGSLHARLVVVDRWKKRSALAPAQSILPTSDFRSVSRPFFSSTRFASEFLSSKLLKKQGWKEGTGLGIAEQGRLEPLQQHVKNNKRGLGAEKIKKKCAKLPEDSSTKEHINNLYYESASWTGMKEYFIPWLAFKEQDQMVSRKKSKALSKRMRKLEEEEKRMQEKEFDQAFFREFWPDNV